MAFDVTTFKTAVGTVNGCLCWTYTNIEGSISGRTPISAAQMADVNPATKTPAQIDAWLDENAGNTPEQLDAAIAKNILDAQEAAEQSDYVNEGGEWVQVSAEAE